MNDQLRSLPWPAAMQNKILDEADVIWRIYEHFSANIEGILSKHPEYSPRTSDTKYKPDRKKNTVGEFVFLSGLDRAIQGCVLICKQCVGIDKLAHFFQQGFEYFLIDQIYGRQAKAAGASARGYGEYLEGIGKETDYKKSAVDFYKNLKLPSGDSFGWAGGGFGFFGRGPSGVISRGDLAANASGQQFYDDVFWGRFKTICDYVTKNWDEEQNPSEYIPVVAAAVKANKRR